MDTVQTKRLLMVLYVCLFAISLFGVAEAERSESFPALRRLQTAGGRVSALAIRLSDLQVVGSINPDGRLTPASITKVVLGAAALEQWGAEHSFVSRLYSTTPIQGGVISGDLVFVGSGDPYLTNEKLWFLTSDVARRGIKEVRGDLVLNTSLFGAFSRDGNRAAGRISSAHAYDSPLSAVALNFGVVAGVVSPAQKSGEEALVALEPYSLENFKIQSNVTTGRVGSPAALSATRIKTGGKTDEIKVSGSVAVNGFPERIYRSVSDSEQHAGAVLRAFLAQAGVSIRGRIRIETKPSVTNLFPVSQVDGFPLDWQLKGLFKMSNNFIGDMLTILLDIDDSKLTGATLAGGTQKLSNYLRKVLEQSPFESSRRNKNFTLASGSGLTPENRLSAQDVVSLLHRMYYNKREFPAYLSAFPIPGSEGTVKRRFSSPAEEHLRDSVRAKTGTLTEPVDAVALAGYVRSSKDGWSCFAIIANGSGSRPSIGVNRLREAIDSDLGLLFPPEI